MFSFFKQSNRILYQSTFKLIILTILCSLFLFGRIIYFSSAGYIFLIWNLFLAWLPYCLSFVYTNHKFKRKYVQFIFGLTWFIFYPNAPYMLTDFIHLSKYNFYGDIVDGKRVFSSDFSNWYDFFLISIFVIISLALSYLSLSIMHKYIKDKYNNMYGWVFICAISIVSGFAIYLGRFTRLNSWEIVSNPIYLMNVIRSNFTVQCLLFTILFGTLILIVYLTFFIMNKNHSQNF